MIENYSTKSLNWLVALLLVGSSLTVFNSCKRSADKENKPLSHTDIMEMSDVVAIHEMMQTSLLAWIPPGAIAVKIWDSDLKDSVVRISADSAHWVYLGADIGGGIPALLPPTISVTCTCTGGGCDPVINGKTTGCLSNGCTPCVMRRKEVSLHYTGFTIDDARYTYGGGFVKSDYKVDFMDPADSLPYSFPAMFQHVALKNKYENFLMQYYSDLGSMPDPVISNDSMYAISGYSLVALNVAGRAHIVMLPTDSIPEEAMRLVSCSCSCAGSGSCTPANSGHSFICNSNGCTTCTATCELPEEKPKKANPDRISSNTNGQWFYHFSNYAF